MRSNVIARATNSSGHSRRFAQIYSGNMSRCCGEDNPEPILRAGEEWRSRGLLTNGSLFSEHALWSEQNLQSLERYYVDQPDESDGTFLEKLKVQLESAPSDTKRLAAEMTWLMLLCPSNISIETKREQVRLIWSWSGDTLDERLDLLSPQVLAGIGSAGQSFNFNRWRELVFFVQLMLKLKRLPPTERNQLLDDGWSFADWLSTVPESNTRQLRHMILFILFPDYFERIFGGSDRRQIVAFFSGKTKAEVDELSPIALDRELLEIRNNLEAKYQTSKLDFYSPPLLAQWKERPFKTFTKDVAREHVLKALKEIDKNGVPPDARSTTYDLVSGHHRYPPKLVLSIATRYANGEEFDRSLFSGGEKSQAFALLRDLKFQIERKDFAGALIQQFLVQAEAADDLSTKQYPKSFRGLSVVVSFGKGNLARIPRIAFL